MNSYQKIIQNINPKLTSMFSSIDIYDTINTRKKNKNKNSFSKVNEYILTLYVDWLNFKVKNFILLSWISNAY